MSSLASFLDYRKTYPQAIKDMSRWRAWSERVLRWARMQSTDLHSALVAATKSREQPIAHDVGDESVFFWADVEDWMTDSEALSIVKHVRDDVGIEAFRPVELQV